MSVIEVFCDFYKPVNNPELCRTKFNVRFGEVGGLVFFKDIDAASDDDFYVRMSGGAVIALCDDHWRFIGVDDLFRLADPPKINE